MIGGPEPTSIPAHAPGGPVCGASHEAQHRPVRVGDVHRNPKVSTVMDVAMADTEFGAAIDHGRHLLCAPQHEGTDIEAVQDRTARTIFALAQTDHEPRFVIGKDDTSDCGVLEELVGQFQIEEVTHRQLDLADADDGQPHPVQCVKAPPPAVSPTPKVGVLSDLAAQTGPTEPAGTKLPPRKTWPATQRNSRSIAARSCQGEGAATAPPGTFAT